ncbi:MAG: ribonuclease III [Alphaproteobacteria bacterium]|nr:ribonuclease III [Alphaproteobacteria bacterium]
MKKLKYKFKDESLFNLAMTQSGADAVNNNERLEFIGDRVLGLSVAALLYEMFPTETEGELARRHAVLVSTETLATVAKEFGFDKKIRHGHMTGGKINHIAANAMESVLGAIYLDSGFDAANAEVARIWRDIAAKDITPPKDAKTALQEFVQKNSSGALPEYEFIEADGKSHSPVFNVRVSALGHSATGRGTSKKSATAAAAAELLKILE